MPAMKVTPNAAMRARDVSRPHPEQVRWAEEAEASAAGAMDAVIRADVAPESGVAGTGARHWPAGAERPEMLGAAAPSADTPGVDIPDSESPDVEDGPEDADRADGARRRRVRGFRSSSRRGRGSR
jgi:hypothetical protein